MPLPSNSMSARSQPSPARPAAPAPRVPSDSSQLSAPPCPTPSQQQRSPRTPRRTHRPSHHPIYALHTNSTVSASAVAATSVPSHPTHNPFAAFLQTDEYRMRESAAAALVSRRSGGGGTARKQRERDQRRGGAGGALPPLHFDSLEGGALEDHEREKGDYAIVIRLESKLFSHRALALAQQTTQPPSLEHSTSRHLSDINGVPPHGSGASSVESSTTRPEPEQQPRRASAPAAPAPAPAPSPRFSVIGSATTGRGDLRRASVLASSSVPESKRLQTLCARLAHAGLSWVKEPQIVNQQVLLRVYARTEVLERAAFALRLKMPLKPLNAQSHPLDPVTPVAAADGVSGGAASNGTSSSSSSSVFDSYAPFDPALRDQFLGTSDPLCLFRSAERQILIDHLLRLSRSQGGAGLGNQHANEVEYARKRAAKAKEKAARQRKLRREQQQKAREMAAAAATKKKKAVTAPTSTTTAPPAADEQEHSNTGDDVAEEDDDTWSSDDDDADDAEEAAAAAAAAAAASASSSADSVPNIEQYITMRFPLHSSRLEDLDAWMRPSSASSSSSFTASSLATSLVQCCRSPRTSLQRLWRAGRALLTQPLDPLNLYFGNGVGFFYAFLQFYNVALLVPSIAGLVLFLTQLSLSTIDSPLLPLFSLFFAVWSSVLIEVWKRRESSLSWRWGSFEYEEEAEPIRAEFQGEESVNPLTGEKERRVSWRYRLGKMALSGALWTTLLGGVGYGMIHVFRTWDAYVLSRRRGGDSSPSSSADGEGADTSSSLSSYFSVESLFVPCVWGILIPLLDMLFGHWALRLTEWENWRLGSIHAAAFTAKVFSFRFTNAFLVLFYYIFADDDDDDGKGTQGGGLGMSRLTTSVASFMIVGQILRFIQGAALPWAQQKYAAWRARKSNNPSSSSEEEPVQLSRAWLESTYPPYSHFEEYACLAVQYGYVCFFSCVFPFAPLLALVANLASVKLGMVKLVRLTRRPLASKMSGLGIWVSVLQFMSIIAVLANCALIAVTSQSDLLGLGKLEASTKILLVFAFEHLVILVKIGITMAIPDVTEEVQRHRKKEKMTLMQAQTQVMERRRIEYVQHQNDLGDAASFDKLTALTLP